MSKSISILINIVCWIIPFIYIFGYTIIDSAKYFIICILMTILSIYILIKDKSDIIRYDFINYIMLLIIMLIILQSIFLNADIQTATFFITMLILMYLIYLIKAQINWKILWNGLFFSGLILACLSLVEVLGLPLFPETKKLFIFHHYPISATLGNPNYVSEFLLPVSLIGIYKLYYENKTSYLFYNAIILSAIFFTYNRYGIIISLIIYSVLIFISIYNLFKTKSKKIILITCSLLVTAILIFTINHFSSYAKDVQSIDDKIVSTFPVGESKNGLESRLYINLINFEILHNNFVSGVGLGNFQEHWMEEQGIFFNVDEHKKYTKYCSNLANAHNDWLEILISFGFPIGFIIIVFPIFIIFRLVKRKVYINNKFVLMMTLSFILLICNSLISSPLFKPSTTLLFILIIIYLSNENSFKNYVPSEIIKKIILYNVLFLSVLLTISTAYIIYVQINFEDSLKLYYSHHYKDSCNNLLINSKYENLNYKNYYLYALNKTQMKEYKEAIYYFDKAWNGYKNIECLIQKADCYENVKDYIQAEETYLKILFYFPFYKEMMNNLALVYVQNQKYEDALRWLNKAIEIDPKYKPAIVNKNNLLSIIEN